MVWMWVVREREFTDEATDLGQSLWKSGVAMDWGGEDIQQDGEDQSLVLVILSL